MNRRGSLDTSEDFLTRARWCDLVPRTHHGVVTSFLQMKKYQQ